MNKKRLGAFALIYSVLLLAVLVIRIVYVYTICDRIVPNWFIFYRFTYLTNGFVLIWLVVFGVCCLSKRVFWIEGYIIKRWLIVSLMLYSALLFIYFIIGVSIGGIAFYGDGLRFAFNVLRRLFTYVFTPVIMCICFFVLRKGNRGRETDREINAESKIRIALIALVFPVMYFAINMIIGHTVYYGEGIGAFAYEALDPALYVWWLFAAGVVFALIVLFAVALLISLIYQKSKATYKNN